MSTTLEAFGSVANKWDKQDSMALEKCRELCEKLNVVLTNWLILVNATTQRLYLLELMKNRKPDEEKKDESKPTLPETDFRLSFSYPVSTAAKGVGQIEGSGQTPLGLHCIQTKIGDEAPPFAIFKSRELTGEIAAPQRGGKDIVGRILWLQGLQAGENQGKNSEEKIVDTYFRYIYIHGTNDLEIGTAVSAGCIRMFPNDVIALFDKVPERTLVYIYV